MFHLSRIALQSNEIMKCPFYIAVPRMTNHLGVQLVLWVTNQVFTSIARRSRFQFGCRFQHHLAWDSLNITSTWLSAFAGMRVKMGQINWLNKYKLQSLISLYKTAFHSSFQKLSITKFARMRCFVQSSSSSSSLSLMASPLTTLGTHTQLIHYPCSIQSLPQNRISNSTDISLFLLAFLFPEDLPWQRLTVQIWRNLLRLPLCSTSLCSDRIPLLQMCRLLPQGSPDDKPCGPWDRQSANCPVVRHT